MKKDTLTTRQAILWFTMYQIGTSFLVLPGYLALYAKQDAWLSVALAIALQLPLIYLYTAIGRQMNGQTALQFASKLLGKLGGKLVLLLFVLAVPYLIFIMTLRNLGDFMIDSAMPDTPVIAFYIFLLVPVYYIIRSGVGVIGRTAQIIAIWFVMLFVLIAVSVTPSIRLVHLLPIMEVGWKPIVLTSFTVLGFPYLENVLFLFLVPDYAEPHKLKKIYMTSTLVSGAMFLLTVILTISVLGPTAMEQITYPSYFVVRTISIADIVERFDIIVTIFWILTTFFRLILLLYVTNQVLTDLLKLKAQHALLIPLLLIALVSAFWIWPNLPYLFQLFSLWYLYAFAFGIVAPALLWCVGKLRALPGNR